MRVTDGNLRNNHLYVKDLRGLLPDDCFGDATSGNGQIEIVLDGLGETVKADIGVDSKTGRRRGYFRGRTWIRRFFEHHRVAADSVLEFEGLGERRFRLRPHSAPARPRAAEFFSGIGLVRLALERQGWQVVFANDIDADKAEMYRHNWPQNEDLVEGDIYSIAAEHIPDCELFTASFPCNDLSIAGKWEGLAGKESSAFWQVIRLLRDMGDRRPPLVLLENVVGFLMSREGADLEQALSALGELGYCVDAVILNAKHWTPQSRARLFVIAKKDTGGDRHPMPAESDARPAPLVQFAFLNQHLPWNFQSLPRLPKPTARLADIVEDLPDDDPHWWNNERAAYFMSQLSEKHAAEAAERIASDSISYATAFRRVRKGKSMAELRTDGIAGCLRTPRGGSGRQILFKAGAGRYQVRLLTARECARLQGVPDSYAIDVPLNQALFGFGDAVCVPAVEWIAANHLSTVAFGSDL
jgi:DNA (cytosine-5)-methyltransferase 1